MPDNGPFNRIPKHVVALLRRNASFPRRMPSNPASLCTLRCGNTPLGTRSGGSVLNTFGAVQHERGQHRILVVGQTPPPLGGQAVMLKAFLDGKYDRIKLYHVRMAFSDDMNDVGKFAFRKITVLISTIARIVYARIRYRTSTLYYPPAGPNVVPVLRDLAILISTRWLFRHTVFHFHAGGVSSMAAELPTLVRPFFWWAYRRPSLAIRTSSLNPDDGKVFEARRNVVIPNGIEDFGDRVKMIARSPEAPTIVLFTGVLIRSKGVKVLLEAIKAIHERGRNVQVQLMGRWGDPDLERECQEFIVAHGLADQVVELGVLQGASKLAHFAACDVFCFPSYFEAESFGLVLLEAMSFAKPVVSTHWRGIPSVVVDGVSGLLVPIKDPGALAEQLLVLIDDPERRHRMGMEGRRIFEAKFTLEVFRKRMEEELNSFCGTED